MIPDSIQTRADRRRLEKAQAKQLQYVQSGFRGGLTPKRIPARFFMLGVLHTEYRVGGYVNEQRVFPVSRGMRYPALGAKRRARGQMRALTASVDAFLAAAR